jgi:ATP-dependent RNA helicase DeaD
MELRPELVKALRKQGFKTATPIQALVIPAALKGRDVVCEAKTGSGKTLAYGLPLLQREPRQAQYPEALVIAPTRELAQQIEAELVKARGTLPHPVISLSGGGGIDKQKKQLDAGVAIVVGTVGRLEDLLARKLLRLDHVRMVVLDEVDELLRGGFASNLGELFGRMPRDRQTLLFSATVPTEVETLARTFTRSPARLQVSAAREVPAELTHRVIFTTVDDRIRNLVGYLRADRPFQALVFTGTRHEAEEVEAAISELGLEAEFLHGELSPNKRRQLLERFRSGDLPVLVASDLAARGLDLPGVDLVVHYSLPKGTAAYLHRAGRTGRAGRPGVVLSLVIGQQHEEFEKLRQLFEFESVEISVNGKLFTHPTKTREERDFEFRKLPAGPRPRPAPAPTPPKREPSSKFGTRKPPAKTTFRGERPGRSPGAPRTERKPPRRSR